VLGQQSRMVGQSELIDKENKARHTGAMRDEFGRPKCGISGA